MLWSDESIFEIFGSICRVHCREGEWMVSIYKVPSVKHEEKGVMVWGALLVVLLEIYSKLKAQNLHGYHSLLQ